MTSARVIVRYIKRKLEEKARKAKERAQLYNGAEEASIAKIDTPAEAEAEEEDYSKWVYDIKMVRRPPMIRMCGSRYAGS